MANDTPIVGILMGSKSDWDVMNNVMETLEALNIPYEAKILSAHRNPELVNDYSKTARDRGLKVIIAGAGMAAALPGVIAALTPLPVLGVPMETKVMGGMDSLLSMAQMPGGVPVGTLAIGKAGAKNAALLAAAILALSDKKIAQAVDDLEKCKTTRLPTIHRNNRYGKRLAENRAVITPGLFSLSGWFRYLPWITVEA